MKSVLKLIIVTGIGLLAINAAVAQQSFKVRYKFTSRKFNDSLLYRLPDSVFDRTAGYVIMDGKLLPFHRIKIPSLVDSEKRLIKTRLYGLIDRRTDDSLFIHFFYIVPSGDPVKGSRVYVNSVDNNRNFVYLMSKHFDSSNHFDIPFSYWILTATSIPYKIDLKTGTTYSNFLDANIAGYYMMGRTRYYQNTDIDPRNFSFGVGGYLGLNKVPDQSPLTNAFGLTYGGSAVLSVFSVNLVGAVGFQKFLREPYFGIGFGFNLVSLFTPSN